MEGIFASVFAAWGKPGKRGRRVFYHDAQHLLFRLACSMTLGLEAGAEEEVNEQRLLAQWTQMEGGVRALVHLPMWQQTFPGWNITINPIARAQQIKQGRTLQFNTGGWLADYPEAQDFLTILWTKTAAYNYGYVDVPAADAALVRADSTLDDATRLPLYQQAEQAFVDDGAFIAWRQVKVQSTRRSYRSRPRSRRGRRSRSPTRLRQAGDSSDRVTPVAVEG
jgi:hypothetical protein